MSRSIMIKSKWFFALALVAVVMASGCSKNEEQAVAEEKDPYARMKDPAYVAELEKLGEMRNTLQQEMAKLQAAIRDEEAKDAPDAARLAAYRADLERLVKLLEDQRKAALKVIAPRVKQDSPLRVPGKNQKKQNGGN